jgi:hypothetical protein
MLHSAPDPILPPVAPQTHADPHHANCYGRLTATRARLLTERQLFTREAGRKRRSVATLQTGKGTPAGTLPRIRTIPSPHRQHTRDRGTRPKPARACCRGLV